MNNEPAALTVDDVALYPVQLEQQWDAVPGAEPERRVRMLARSVLGIEEHAGTERAQLEVSITRITPGRVSYRAGSILLSDDAVYALAAELLGVDSDLLRDFVRDSTRED